MPAASSLPQVPTHRLAPLLHFITQVDDVTRGDLSALAERAHTLRKPLDEVCYALTARALAHGYSATIAVQEVASTAMPSYPGEQVVTPLLMLDLRSLRPRPARPSTLSR